MFDDEASRYVTYEVDLQKNPSEWPSPDAPSGKFQAAFKVDVLYVNSAPTKGSFRMCRTGTNENHQRVLLQVAKHVVRGLYSVESMNISTYACVIVLKTSMSEDDMEKGGFPWDRAELELPEVVLK